MLPKNRIPHIVLLFISLTWFSCSTNKNTFTKRDVKKSEKLIGLHFETKYRDTLYPYLKRNRSGFDSLRKYPLANDIFPAIRFDPTPFGFTMPEQQNGTEWNIPDNVEIPEPYNLLAFYTIPQLASLIKNQK